MVPLKLASVTGVLVPAGNSNTVPSSSDPPSSVVPKKIPLAVYNEAACGIFSIATIETGQDFECVGLCICQAGESQHLQYSSAWLLQSM